MAAPNIKTMYKQTIKQTNMAHAHYWGASHTPTSESDVKFFFVDKNTEEEWELFAHKTVLATGSDVFMAQFYGSLPEKRDTIPVKDSSFNAFKILLDVLYNKHKYRKVQKYRKFSPLVNISYTLLAELFYLANKYILAEMQDLIIQEVSSRKMILSKFLEAAKVAEENVHMETFSECLHKVCVNFVIENIHQVFMFFDSEEAEGAAAITLHRLMAKANLMVKLEGGLTAAAISAATRHLETTGNMRAAASKLGGQPSSGSTPAITPRPSLGKLDMKDTISSLPESLANLLVSDKISLLATSDTHSSSKSRLTSMFDPETVQLRSVSSVGQQEGRLADSGDASQAHIASELDTDTEGGQLARLGQLGQ